MALIMNPEILILDEPTTGLDPASRWTFWKIIQSIKQDKITIMTTHFMEEAEILGDRIGIMKEGEVLYSENSYLLKH